MEGTSIKKTRSKEYDLIAMLDKLILDLKRGRRIQKNGKKVRLGTVANYTFLRKLLVDLSATKGLELRVRSVSRLNQRELKSEKNYWKKFYKAFTDYLYTDLDCFDNYTGLVIKTLRAFFNYLNQDLSLNIGNFHLDFYAPSEEIQIVVLSPERLNFLIYNKEFENALPYRLQKIKDTFVFGCSAALRFSDLMNLKPSNLEVINERTYLRVTSLKTQTFTRIKLQPHALDILKKYRKNRKYLLHQVSKVNLNKYIKELMERAGWTEPFVRTRMKRGIPLEIYKDKKTKTHFRFCDMITSHSMRRTAITSLLSVGMPENMVRKVSGHAANSKEFYRYVNYSQTYMDKEMDTAFEKLGEKQLEPVM